MTQDTQLLKPVATHTGEGEATRTPPAPRSPKSPPNEPSSRTMTQPSSSEVTANTGADRANV